MRTFAALLRCMRPWQYTKNLLVFAAVIFAHRLGDPSALMTTVIAFVLFCMVSSAVYLINDVRDREEDRRHPEKCRRPIACGALSPGLAIGAAVALVLVGVAGSFVVNVGLGAVTLGYFGLQMLYQLILKQLVLLDVFAIAAGFVLRAVAGAEAIEVVISPWLLICTLLLLLTIPSGTVAAAEVESPFDALLPLHNLRSHRRRAWKHPTDVHHPIRHLRALPLRLPDASRGTWRRA